MNGLRKIISLSRERNVGNVARRVGLGVSERLYDRWFGIHTRLQIELTTLGIRDPDAVVCSPVPYAAFFRAMRFVGADYANCGFIDYGCGLGRPVCCAATLPFKRVIGIELAPQIAQQARENVQRARGRFRCSDVQIVTGNAAEWRVPDDAAVFHFYNPFMGRTLRTVFREIARSMRENQRLAWIMAAEPWQVAGLMRIGKIIPHSWQIEEHTVSYPYFQDTGLHDPDKNRYRVFMLNSWTDRVDVED